MSCSARKAASGVGPVPSSAWQRLGSSVSRSKWTMGQDIDVVHAVRVKGCHRAPAGSPEADDGRPEPAAIFTSRPDEFQGMQHRAVAGQFVVLVKDMQAERTVSIPVVHRLKGDQGEPPLDAQLGDLLVLDTMRPAPQDLPDPHLRQVLGLRLGQQDDIAFREELFAGTEPGHTRCELVIGYAELLAVAALKIDAFPQVSIDPFEVQRMDREPPLVLLPRPRYHSEAEQIHTRSLARGRPHETIRDSREPGSPRISCAKSVTWAARR
jgi:hypothetical protein